MAANYWESTQFRFWIFTKPQLALERKKLEDAERHAVNLYPLPELRHLSIYFLYQLTKLAKSLSIRPQAVATAQIYVRRFYTKVEIRRTNPFLVLATALYLACKVEECPQHIRIILAEARNCWDGSFDDIKKIGECEFTLISELNSQLIIHHPYRSLGQLHRELTLSQEEFALAWAVINDHYLTDLPLMFPPHIVATAAVTIAVVLKPPPGGIQITSMIIKSAMHTLSGPRTSSGSGEARTQQLVDWLARSSIEMEPVVATVQEMISLYQVWDDYNEKACKEQITKFVKWRGLDH